jgi:hypothetical protein
MGETVQARRFGYCRHGKKVERKEQAAEKLVQGLSKMQREMDARLRAIRMYVGPDRDNW